MDEHSYDDIINLPNPISKNHPRMSLHDRAAQFAPFAALTGHDAAIKETARLTDERLDTIMEQMKAAEGVTEELKRTHQMEWVQRCNNIHNRAEEIILREIIYS